MRGMARRVWLAGWASHRLELTATSPLIDLCTPVGKHTRGRPGKSRSCDGQGRRSVVTDKAGDHVTQHDARPALARSAPTHQAPVGYSPPWCSAHVRSLFPRFDLFPQTSFPNQTFFPTIPIHVLDSRRRSCCCRPGHPKYHANL